MKDSSKILEILKKIKIGKVSDFNNLIQSRLTLSRLAASGDVIALGAGLYAHPSLDPFTASIIAVARYYPEAIISKSTALVFHQLSDARIDRIDVDIRRETSIRNRLIYAHRTAERYLIGIEKISYNDEMIRIYDLERSLCEAYRMDPDGEIFVKAVKRYSANQPVDFEKIANYDKKLSTQVLRAIKQEVADG
jgi:predicted transcriptional regulator of viral defense system